jgi:phosphate transport system permease protein
MSDPAASPFANERALKRLRRRRAADRRFKWYGRLAIGFALAALTLLLASITTQAMSAATYHVVSFDLDLDKETFGGLKTGDPPPVDKVYGLVRADLLAQFPETARNPVLRHELTALVSRLAVLPVAREIVRNPREVGTIREVQLPLSDDLDLYLKGANARHLTVPMGAWLRRKRMDVLTLTGDGAFKRLIAAASLEGLQTQGASNTGSILMTAGQSTLKLSRWTRRASQARS